MSIQAVGWVLGQDVKSLPPKPRLVLLAIANHADYTTGYCWLHLDTIADESAIPVRSLFRYIGALVRNGYLRKQLRRGDDGRQRATDYWILFERIPADWKWDAKLTDDGDPQDIDPSATLADGEYEVADDDEMHDLADGPSAIVGSAESLDEPSKTKPEKSAHANPFAAPPRGYKAPPIVPEPQGATHTQTNERIFVYRGTPAWNAWMDERKRAIGIGSSPTYRKFVEGVGYREGWDFPTLFPPRGKTEKESSEEGRATGPPLKKPT